MCDPFTFYHLVIVFLLNRKCMKMTQTWIQCLVIGFALGMIVGFGGSHHVDIRESAEFRSALKRAFNDGFMSAQGGPADESRLQSGKCYFVKCCLGSEDFSRTNFTTVLMQLPDPRDVSPQLVGMDTYYIISQSLEIGGVYRVVRKSDKIQYVRLNGRNG